MPPIALTLILLCLLGVWAPISAQGIESWNLPCQKHLKSYKSAAGPKAFATSNANSGGGLGQACGASWNASSLAAAKKEALRQCNSARYGTCWVTQSSGGAGAKKIQTKVAVDDKVIKSCTDGKPDEAIDACTKLIVAGNFKKEGIAWLYYSRGYAYSQKKNAKLAISDYKNAISLDKKFGYAYFNLAAEYARQEKFEESASNYRRASVLIEEKDKNSKEARERAQSIESKIAGESETEQVTLADLQPSVEKGDLANGTDQSSRRLALVIGNNKYPNFPVFMELKKAVNDARLVRDTLRDDLGFDVTYGEDVNFDQMKRLVDQFVGAVSKGDVVIIYYSGHGVADKGVTFMLPSDVPKPKKNEEARVIGYGIDATALTGQLVEKGARIVLAIMDACRNDIFAVTGGKSLPGRNGLQFMQEAEGVFMMYSASTGQAALDRLSEDDLNPNSVYTRSLVPLLKAKNLTLEQIAKRVKKEVSELANSIGEKQRPAYYNDITDDIVLNN